MEDAASTITSYASYLSLDEEIIIDDVSMVPGSIFTVTAVMLDPVALEQETTVISPRAFTETEDSEVYFTEDGYFIYEVEKDNWWTYPDEQLIHMPNQIKQQYDLTTTISSFHVMKDEMELEEDDNFYVLHMKFDEERLQEDGLLANSGLNLEALEEHDVHEVSFEVKIDKSTHFIDTLDLAAEFTMDIQDRDVLTLKRWTTEYKYYNQVDEINLPQEAIDQAEIVEQ